LVMSNTLVYKYRLQMLKNYYFFPSDLERVHGFKYPQDQIECLVDRLPEFESVMRRNYDCLLMATPPVEMTLAEVHALRKRESYQDEDKNIIGCEDVVKAASWLLMQRKPHQQSYKMNFEEQMEVLDKSEWVPPNAAEVNYALSTYYKTYGRWPVDGVYRTSTVMKDGQVLHVGTFDDLGICTYPRGGNYRHCKIGIASAWNAE